MKKHGPFRWLTLNMMLMGMVLGGCTLFETSGSEEQVQSEGTASHEDTAVALDGYRRKAEALYQQLQELGDTALSSPQVQELKEAIEKESASLYEEGKKLADQARERYENDEQLQRSVEELRQKTESLIDQISDQNEDHPLDFSGLSDAVKNFGETYLHLDGIH